MLRAAGKPPQAARNQAARRRAAPMLGRAASGGGALEAAAPPPAAGGGGPPQLLDATTAPQLVRRLDTLILDCDGVLWRGSEVVPGAMEALRRLRAAGKRLLFVTNNSSKSRREYAEKFRGLGVDVEPHEVVSSSSTAAAYLAAAGFASSGRSVLLLGGSGVAEELEAAGLAVVDADALGLPVMDSTDAMLQMQLDERVGAVVLGWDCRFSYSKLVLASACLRELPGCLFVATNADHADFIGGPSGRMMPGTGALVAALQVASGVDPINVGKGGSWLLPHLVQSLQLDVSRTAIIGDRLDTDVALGRQGGLATVLPLTGVTTLEEAVAAPQCQRPDYLVRTVAHLAGLASS